jgi:hypothetical protein
MNEEGERYTLAIKIKYTATTEAAVEPESGTAVWYYSGYRDALSSWGGGRGWGSHPRGAQ